MTPEDTIRRFCEAINEHDGDGAAALADPGIVIVIGPNELDGVEALRAMAAQRPEGPVSSVDVLGIQGANGRSEVAARPVQRWAETGELAVDQELSIVIDLNDEGPVARAEMHPKSD